MSASLFLTPRRSVLGLLMPHSRRKCLQSYLWPTTFLNKDIRSYSNITYIMIPDSLDVGGGEGWSF